MFGQQSNQQQQPNSNPFGSSSLFGANTQQQNQEQKPNPFVNNSNKPNLFGSISTSQPQQSSSIFGSLGQPASQPTSQSGGIFGSSQAASSAPQQSSVFGSSQPQQTQTLGKPQAPTQSSLFAPSQPAAPSIFNTGTTQQQQPPPPPPPPLAPQASVLSTSSSILKQSDIFPRPRSVADQIQVVFDKWNPQSPVSLFQSYIYNYVRPEAVPFCQPGRDDNVEKWEEALAKKPHPGAVPVQVRGFEQIGKRMIMQNNVLKLLQGRLHEINTGLTDMLRRHDLDMSIRAAEARKKHFRLNHQCLRLAAKVQVLKNRGYAMDSAEEELKKKLIALERQVMDPALNGRGEEIWARMVSVRERGRQLQREFEKAGRSLPQQPEQTLDEEVMKRATKILEDYSSQLNYLAKELAQLQKDFKVWEISNPDLSNGIDKR
ncbi:MAG: hypothetical protein LQ342_007055 [Letrouitia transgressa]|nr:MAG: hypothetical protein LQ342_007055 [Letrouitia transgressa]